MDTILVVAIYVQFLLYLVDVYRKDNVGAIHYLLIVIIMLLSSIVFDIKDMLCLLEKLAK